MTEMNQYQLTLHNIIKIYQDQLKKFYRLGIGGETEFRTVVTEQLIEITKKRLKQLTMKLYNLMHWFAMFWA